MTAGREASAGDGGTGPKLEHGLPWWRVIDHLRSFDTESVTVEERVIPVAADQGHELVEHPALIPVGRPSVPAAYSSEHFSACQSASYPS